MKIEAAVWAGTAVLILILIGFAARADHFPGDVVSSRFIQRLAPQSPGWAEVVTETAKFPWNFFLIGVVFVLSWWMRSWRLAFLVLASFAGVWLLDKGLKPWIARPRPPADLVQVIGSPSGYSFPSTFALTYAATIGFIGIAALLYARGVPRALIFGFVVLLMILGGLARISLGAHWPSDICLSYLIGLFWAALLIRCS